MASIILVTFWSVASVGIFFAYVLSKYLHGASQEFDDLVKYGKVRSKERKWSIVQLIDVPKRWFLHFYIIGALVNGLMLIVIANAYMSKVSLPFLVQLVLHMMNIFRVGPAVTTDAMTAVLLISMMTFQNVRRLLECRYVSIFSPHGTMNMLHYTLGIVFYATYSFAVMSEAPNPLQPVVTFDTMKMVNWRNVFGIMLFLIASWYHNRAHVQLANLRKSKAGITISYEHSIPRGGLFDYVSCPHYLMEILIYISFGVITGLRHFTLLSILVFVIVIQLVAGLLNHDWYRHQFKSSYPSERRAVIPYLL